MEITASKQFNIPKKVKEIQFEDWTIQKKLLTKKSEVRAVITEYSKCEDVIYNLEDTRLRAYILIATHPNQTKFIQVYYKHKETDIQTKIESTMLCPHCKQKHKEFYEINTGTFSCSTDFVSGDKVRDIRIKNTIKTQAVCPYCNTNIDKESVIQIASHFYENRKHLDDLLIEQDINI